MGELLLPREVIEITNCGECPCCLEGWCIRLEDRAPMLSVHPRCPMHKQGMLLMLKENIDTGEVHASK